MKVLALALAVIVVPVAAQAATKKHHHMSQQARGSYAYQRQIACTQVGCLPGSAWLPSCRRANILRNAERLRRDGLPRR